MLKLENELGRDAVRKAGTRDGYGAALIELARDDERIVALSADLPESTRVLKFKEDFPERYFDTGVAEANMIGIAAGLALDGKIPFASSFGVFSPALTWGQIRVSVCYSDANVKVVASHTGITTGEDGASHQATEDIAIMRSLPGMVVLVPCDYEQTKRATEAASAYQGPVYIRFGREKVASMTTAETPFEVGKAQLFREGSDVTIVACGIMVYESMVAAESLATEGISAQVVNCHTVKPLDKSMIVEAVAKTGAVVTAEEHQLDGGLGGAVAEAVSTEIAVPVEMVGVDNTFGESGKPAELMKKYGITAENVVAAAKAAIARKKP